MVAIIEDSLFFGDWHYPANFHKQKLWLHRATMKRYQSWLEKKKVKVEYVEYEPDSLSLDSIIRRLAKSKKNDQVELLVSDPVDFILEKRIRQIANKLKLSLTVLPTPGFLNQKSDNAQFKAKNKRWLMANYYKFQRQRLNVLIDSDGKPTGGKWSFDSENRKKIPKKLLGEIPPLPKAKRDSYDEEAVAYVQKRFSNNRGSINELFYPTSFAESKKWLKSFLKNRLERFGPYEDAIEENESWLWHSVLTPMLNVGLLTPDLIVKETLKFCSENEVSLNSQEGFLRQVIGWREFMRATYNDLGIQMRNGNHWDHHRKIPASFYDGTTGIFPIDNVIKRILKTGYCHHIERLMVLGGFMFLCEFHPREVYRWFMEMFVDSYDWVMVTNAFAMSQNADGGLITTKPYFSGSSYIRKMSHYQSDDWCAIWDGLYWRWILKHSDTLQKNPRWAMMCASAKKMDREKQEQHLTNANSFLNSIES